MDLFDRLKKKSRKKWVFILKTEILHLRYEVWGKFIILRLLFTLRLREVSTFQISRAHWRRIS